MLAMIAMVLSAEAKAAWVKTTVLEDTTKHTVLRFDIAKYDLVNKKIDGKDYVAIELRREAHTRVAGAPDVPLVARSIIIGNDAEVEATVVTSSYSDIPNVELVPSKGTLLRSKDPSTVPYVFGKEYSVDAFYPAELVSLGEPYVLRDRRGVVVTIHPFQYNPVTRVLRVHDSVTVKVARIGVSNVNVLTTSAAESIAFHELSERHFLNHGGKLAYAPLKEQGEMLVIAKDAWLPNLAPFVQHKNAVGIVTKAVGVSTVGSNSSAIKSYLQTAYGNGKLAFVLLVGDAAHVPTPYASGGAADATYSKLAGNDNYPDVLVGRFSAETPAQVDTLVQRSVAFEKSQATQQPWFKTAIGIGSEEGPGDDGEMDWQHIDNIGKKLLGSGFTHVDKFYGSVSTSSVINAFNQGRGLLNYCGHGSPWSFGTSGFSGNSVSSLNNAGKLPFVVSVACNTGEFHTGSCLGEALTRATQGGQATGAVAMYASSISQSWNPPMAAQDEMMDLFVAKKYSTLGALAFAGSARMMDEYGADGAAMFNTWIFFGDPSLKVVGTVKPASGITVTPESGLAAEGNAGGPFAPNEKIYTVTNDGSQPVDFTAAAAASWLNVTPSSGNLPPNGTANITVKLGDAVKGFGEGHWKTSVKIVNVTSHEGDTERAVGVTVGVPRPVYEWPLDVDPGWTKEGAWGFGAPQGKGGGKFGSPDPTSGHTGANVYGYELAGNYPNNLPEKHLTTKPIDCTKLTRVTLKFWRWLNVEGSEFDRAFVRVSTDGMKWTTVWENGADIADKGWQPIELDISVIADGKPNVLVRWTMGATDEGLQASGWNLDDVQIWALQSTCADADGDGDPPPACGGKDCNDGNNAVHTGASENCADKLDNDCDGAIDENDVDCGGHEGVDNHQQPVDDRSDWIPVPKICGCRVVGAPSSSGGWKGVALIAALIAARRAARRRAVHA
jgi:gingipain R